MDSGLIYNTIVGIASSLGVVSLVWNIIDLRRSESGFAKLTLECSPECKGGEKYIISKTSLENTSRKPIKVVAAFLLIVDQSVSFEEGIHNLMKEINEEEQEIIDQIRKSRMATELITIRQYVSKKDNLLHVPGKFTILSLPYYFKTLVKLGSFAHNRTTHIQNVTAGKVYSIYFGAFGKDWFMKGDTSQGRVVHDEVLVK